MAISVRLAGPDDAAALIALSERVATDAPYFLAYDVEPASGADMLQTKLGTAKHTDGCVLVVVVDGRHSRRFVGSRACPSCVLRRYSTRFERGPRPSP